MLNAINNKHEGIFRLEESCRQASAFSMIYRGRRMTYKFGWINIAVRFAMGSPCGTVGKRNARGAKVNEWVQNSPLDSKDWLPRDRILI
jgi:hypothetical protein